MSEVGVALLGLGRAGSFHLESLRPTVKELAKMEVHAQNVFLNFQMRFANN